MTIDLECPIPLPCLRSEGGVPWRPRLETYPRRFRHNPALARNLLRPVPSPLAPLARAPGIYPLRQRHWLSENLPRPIPSPLAPLARAPGNITSSFGSSCANNGKGALNTHPSPSPFLTLRPVPRFLPPLSHFRPRYRRLARRVYPLSTHTIGSVAAALADEAEPHQAMWTPEATAGSRVVAGLSSADGGALPSSAGGGGRIKPKGGGRGAAALLSNGMVSPRYSHMHNPLSPRARGGSYETLHQVKTLRRLSPC
eukprot:8262563-Pyramimonas_sp.AAC.1